MGDNIDFKSLWLQQITSEPDRENLLLQIKKLKQTHRKRLIVTNCLLIATSVFIGWVWIHFQPQLLTTKIGVVLTILAMAIYLMVYNKSFALFKTTTNAQSNREYLNSLLAIKSKQQFMQTTMLKLYFILLSAGIGLYMYEYAARMTIAGAVATYAITAAWILFNWFYLRPKQIKKQQAGLNDLISKIENINNQLTD